MGMLLLLGVVIAVPIGFGIFADRASPESLHRITDWPFKNMPATNGALWGLLFIGTMTALFLGVGIMAHGFKWI